MDIFVIIYLQMMKMVLLNIAVEYCNAKDNKENCHKGSLDNATFTDNDGF